MGIFFFGAVTPRISPFNPKIFPWFAGGAGIILFSILSGLKIVSQSRIEFQNQCGDQKIKETRPTTQFHEPVWKKTVRAIFTFYFMAVWITGVCFFWKFNIAFRDGTPEATIERTETLTDHGNTVYVTPKEKRMVSILEQTMMIAGSSAIVLGALIHFILGVKLFPNTPTLAEKMRKNSE